MSTIRRQKPKTIRDPQGNVLCSCGCGRPVPKGRHRWHSQECVERWLDINDPTRIRQKLWERDRGICAMCGCDADKEYAAWSAGCREAWELAQWLTGHRGIPWEIRKTLTPAEEAHDRDRIYKRWKPPGNWTHGRKTGWDADHIVPVVEGGGLCGLENYRTLCHPCHKQVTKELAARRAATRKSSMPTLPGM